MSCAFGNGSNHNSTVSQRSQRSRQPHSFRMKFSRAQLGEMVQRTRPQHYVKVSCRWQRAPDEPKAERNHDVGNAGTYETSGS